MESTQPGKLLQFAIENCPVEIVSVPNNSMVMFASLFCMFTRGVDALWLFDAWFFITGGINLPRGPGGHINFADPLDDPRSKEGTFDVGYMNLQCQDAVELQHLFFMVESTQII